MNIKEIFLNHFRLAVALMSLLLLLLLSVLFGLAFSVFQHKTESPSLQYGTETIEDLHIGEEFLLSNYYITSQHKHHRFYQIDENNVLTGYGKNDYGQLGNLSSYVHYSPTFLAKNVIHVDSNPFVTLFLADDGTLFGFGKNHENLLLLNSSDTDDPDNNVQILDTPTAIMEDIRYFRCGEESVIVLKNDGSVWWWGKLSSPDLIFQTTSEGLLQREPEKVLDHGIYVTAGLDYFAAIKKDGSLWTWGHNSMGACGILPDKKSSDPNFISKPVCVMKKVKMVWFDSLSFNQKEPENNALFPWKTPYPHTLFIEKKDSSLWAFGKDVTTDNKSLCNIQTLGFVYCSSDFTPITLFSNLSYLSSLSPDSYRDALALLPKEEDVLAKRKVVLEGMDTEEKHKLIQTIASLNMALEEQYIYRDLFTELKDPNSLHWNTFHEKGEVQIGWAESTEIPYEDYKDIMAKEEFYVTYGVPVVTMNKHTADDFIQIIENLKSIVHSENLMQELNILIQEMKLMKEDHDVSHLYTIYYLLHDLDYYLLRYGPTDVGIYTVDDSTILKYYDVLKIYQE